MCSYTLLGLRPIENLKARKELVIRCTKTKHERSGQRRNWFQMGLDDLALWFQERRK